MVELEDVDREFLAALGRVFGMMGPTMNHQRAADKVLAAYTMAIPEERREHVLAEWMKVKDGFNRPQH